MTCSLCDDDCRQNRTCICDYRLPIVFHSVLLEWAVKRICTSIRCRPRPPLKSAQFCRSFGELSTSAVSLCVLLLHCYIVLCLRFFRRIDESSRRRVWSSSPVETTVRSAVTVDSSYELLFSDRICNGYSLSLWSLYLWPCARLKTQVKCQ